MGCFVEKKCVMCYCCCCRHWVDYEDKEIDPEGVKLAEMVIKVGRQAALTLDRPYV
jgi:hypothetical protein